MTGMKNRKSKSKQIAQNGEYPYPRTWRKQCPDAGMNIRYPVLVRGRQAGIRNKPEWNNQTLDAREGRDKQHPDYDEE